MNNFDLNDLANPTIEFLKGLGWNHIHGKDLEIDSRSLAPIIDADFAKALTQINPWINANQIEQVKTELRKVTDLVLNMNMLDY